MVEDGNLVRDAQQDGLAAEQKAPQKEVEELRSRPSSVVGAASSLGRSAAAAEAWEPRKWKRQGGPLLCGEPSWE